MFEGNVAVAWSECGYGYDYVQGSVYNIECDCCDTYKDTVAHVEKICVDYIVSHPEEFCLIYNNDGLSWGSIREIIPKDYLKNNGVTIDYLCDISIEDYEDEVLSNDAIQDALKESENNKKYDIVLCEVEADDGITREQLMCLLHALPKDTYEILRVENPCGNSVAYGFITDDAAFELNYCFNELTQFISKILADTTLETPDETYDFNGFSMWLTR